MIRPKPRYILTGLDDYQAMETHISAIASFSYTMNFFFIWSLDWNTRINALTFRYFSLKMAWDEIIPKDDTYLFICPPHGVFPYGNLLTVNAM